MGGEKVNHAMICNTSMNTCFDFREYCEEMYAVMWVLPCVFASMIPRSRRVCHCSDLRIQASIPCTHPEAVFLLDEGAASLL